MSVVSVTEVAGRSGQQNWKRQRQYTRRFKIYTNSNSDDALVVLSSASVPALLAAYPTDAYALVQDRKATQTADPLTWDVEVSYNSVFEFDPATTDENPLSRPAVWKFSFEKATKAVRFDLNGDAIDNSADAPIDPPLEMETGIPIISIQVNKASMAYSQIATLQDCVNSDTWNGFAPHTVKVRGIEVERRWENNTLYYAYSWTLAVKWDGWRPTKILDQGYTEVVGTEHKIIRDQFGNPLPSPSLLNGAGSKLPAGADPVYLDFVLNREVAFGGLIP